MNFRSTAPYLSSSTPCAKGIELSVLKRELGEETNVVANEKETRTQSRSDFSASLGVLVHNSVDGLAMGAIARSRDEALHLIVFLAIILHKVCSATRICQVSLSTDLLCFPRHLGRLG